MKTFSKFLFCTNLLSTFFFDNERGGEDLVFLSSNDLSNNYTD